jgi:SAM-dependent MidA family methyltransferase
MAEEEKIFSFRDWMAQNNRAYYSRAFPGKQGDFITSPMAHPAFGGAIARQLIEMDEKLGKPDPFSVYEFGAGTGQLSLNILKTIKEESSDLFPRLSYGISDFSEPASVIQNRFQEEFPEGLNHICFSPYFGSDEFENPEISSGCVLANEFLDALPVHLIVKRGGKYNEVFILEKGGKVEIAEFPPLSEVLNFIESHQIDLPDGVFAEINLEMDHWIQWLSSSLKKGFALIIDYGGIKDEIRGEHKPEGTLRGFKHHRMAEVFNLQIGEGDWTSDIDFSILARLAQKRGLGIAGLATQGDFLLGLGLAERLPTFRKKELTIPDLKEHLGMKFLFHPEGLGNAFHVLGLHKGVSAPKLAGFSVRRLEL